MDRGRCGFLAIGWRWTAPKPPAARAIELGNPAVVVRSASRIEPLRSALDSAELPRCRRIGLDGTNVATVSLVVTAPKPRVRRFFFCDPTATLAPDGTVACNPPSSGPLPAGIRGSTTRIRPPSDVIKLEDRLRYLLEPTLETILAERSLSFPCRPFPYQFQGVAFLYPRHAAVLADEMGLGKTMQAITAIRLLIRCGEAARVLLVCPKPLVGNWRREFEHWAPEIPVMVIQGDAAQRAWQWQAPNVPMRIANYELLYRDQRWLIPSRGAAPGEPPVPIEPFDLVVLDESQRIKNRFGATSQIARAIPRRRGWALTGTPVENSTEDLVGIFEFVAPGLVRPEMKPRRLGRAVADYILRRTKEQVLADLPPKLFRDAELELLPEQRDAYELAEKQGVVQLEALGEHVTIQHVFELILRLKQICNFDPATGASAKLERLRADLDEIARSGRKAIVFSQWVETLERLAVELWPFGPLRYHGRVPPAQREEVVRRFRAERQRRVLLMSYGAGGVGLNLQFANYVFLFDRWWNPAVEDQAINRAHRIGQSEPVIISRFLVLDTIEERIERILQHKRELFDTILARATQRQQIGLSQEELFGLFQLRCPGGALDAAA